jgi:hypothetical protein
MHIYRCNHAYVHTYISYIRKNIHRNINNIFKFLIIGAPSSYKEFDFDALKNSMGASWVLDENFEKLRDESHMNQSVFNFFPIPSVYAKSSSEDDIKKLIVRNILVTLCNMSKCCIGSLECS